jgi:DtxR family Mn-dependent transcriptional regulator
MVRDDKSHSLELLQELLSVMFEKSERQESTISTDLLGVRHGDHVFTQETLQGAVSDGYVAQKNGHVELTPVGRREAESIVRRGRLAERLLVDVLRIRDDLVEPSACRLEHSLSEEVADSICTLLGHPRTCPHGHAIPPGECCRTAEREVHPIVRALSSLGPGEEGSVAYVSSRFHHRLTRLASLGLMPGQSVLVKQVRPSFVVAYGEMELALEKDVADEIYVTVPAENRRR